MLRSLTRTPGEQFVSDQTNRWDFAALRRRFDAATDYQVIPGGRKKLDYIFSVAQRLLKEKGRVRVLDVGCGNGSLTFPLAALGCLATGVDIDAGSIERNRADRRPGNAQFEVVSGDDFDLHEKFDLVICSEVLEHLHVPQPLVDTISRHLEPGGLLVVTVPNGYGPREVLGRTENFLRERLGFGKLIDPIRGAFGMVDKKTKWAVHTSNPEQEHVQKFTTGQMRKLFDQAGLSLQETINSIFIFGVIFGKNPKVDHLDGRLADHLPHFASSGWYFLCRKNEVDPASQVASMSQYRGASPNVRTSRSSAVA